MKRGSFVVVACLLVGCSLGPTVIGTYDSGSNSGSGTEGATVGPDSEGPDPVESTGDESDAGSSSTGEPFACPGTPPPLCRFCAPDLAGVACAADAEPCSNGVDEACACQGGVWVCSDASQVTACGPSCSEADECPGLGCLDRLVVDFDVLLHGEYGTVDTGMYTVHVIADGEPRTCEIEVRYDTYSLDYAYVLWGCDTEGYGFHNTTPDLRVAAHPNTVYAEILFEGDAIAQGEVADIEYTMIELNGPGCPEVCLWGEISIPSID